MAIAEATRDARSWRASGSRARRASRSCATATCWSSGALADAVRQRLHPEAVVTYIIDRNINYTNVCTAQCAFCAFYRDLPSKEGYLLTKPQLAQKIEETLALGGNQILLQGGLHPDLGIEFYEELFRWMKATLPDLDPRALAGRGQAHLPRLEA